MFYDVFTRHWGWEGNFHLPVTGMAVARHTPGEGQARAPGIPSSGTSKRASANPRSLLRTCFLQTRGLGSKLVKSQEYRMSGGVGGFLGLLFELSHGPMGQENT